MEILKLYFEGNDYCSNFFRLYVEHRETSLEMCDYVVSDSFEFGNDNKKQLQKKLNKYKHYNKKVIIFLISDYNNLLKIPKNVTLFRTSLYKSLKKENEEVLPYIWESFDQKFHGLAKTTLPIVGFCGNIKRNSGLRLSTINAFKKNKKITPNFITLLSFGGGKNELIAQFKKNILDSHFTISNRGRGNFSIRFYQVLSLGRIPALIDTEMVFPFENTIEWENIIIKAKNETELVKKIENFWKTKSNEELLTIQENCKNIFDDYFTFKGYGKKIELFLKEKKENPIKIKNDIFNFLKFPHLKYKVKKYFYNYKLKIFQKINLKK